MSVMFVSLVAFNALLFTILICFRRDRSGPRVDIAGPLERYCISSDDRRQGDP